MSPGGTSTKYTPTCTTKKLLPPLVWPPKHFGSQATGKEHSLQMDQQWLTEHRADESIWHLSAGYGVRQLFTTAFCHST